MPRLPDVSRRRLEPELIDQPDLDPSRHEGALAGLARINWFSGSARILWPPIRSLAVANRKRTLRVLDVACGAGDVTVALWRKARRAGLPIEVEGCDKSPRAIEHSNERARRARADVRFFVCDVLSDPLPDSYDIIVCSLFLHHLDEHEAALLLSRMAAGARHLLLVNDLVRTTSGFFLAWIGTRLLTTSDVVHQDGPQSVEGAFRLDEVRGLCDRAGLQGATIRRRWPCRFLLSWQRVAGTLRVP